jgi:hypothetical protein
VQKKMVPKHELLQSIPLHDQMLNYRVNICELEYHVREKGWSLNWPTKFGLAKKTPLVTFLNHLLENT